MYLQELNHVISKTMSNDFFLLNHTIEIPRYVSRESSTKLWNCSFLHCDHELVQFFDPSPKFVIRSN